MVESWMIELGITGLVTLIGYLLKQKDNAQEKLIEDQAKLIADLYTKHNLDVDRLHNLEIQLAQNHYQKGELNLILGEVRDTFKAGVSELSFKLDQLNTSFLNHIVNGKKEN